MMVVSLKGCGLMNNHVKLFHRIAPIYGLFYRFQLRKYRHFLKQMQKRYPDFKGEALDVGFGTGALMHALIERGFYVHGVDAAPNMVKIAKKKLHKYPVTIHGADVLEGLPFARDVFDVAVSSYVLHGLKEEERLKMYAEMKRVSRNFVVFYEHSFTPSLPIRVAERLEGGEYFAFKERVSEELQKHFPCFESLKLSKKVIVYLCQVKEK